jgi:hypothetical protein
MNKINEGQTQVYMNGEVNPQAGVNTSALYLNNPPQQLMDLIREFKRSGKSDAQILAILVGMGTPQQMALSGIGKYNADTMPNVDLEENKQQKNHNKMNFTLIKLYENVTRCINSLKEMTSDNSRVSYSANDALNVLENSLTKFPMKFNVDDTSNIDEEIETAVNPVLKFKIARDLHNALGLTEWLNPVKELRSYIEDVYNKSKWSFKIAEAAERNSQQNGKLYENLTNELSSLLSEPEDFHKSKFMTIAYKHPWSKDCKELIREMAEGDKVASSNNSGNITTLFSPVLKTEKGIAFHLHGKDYIFNGNEITETVINDPRFYNVLEGLKIFKHKNGSLVAFGKNDKTLELNVSEGTLKLGDLNLTNASIVELKESLLATSFFGYKDQYKIDQLCKFFESIDLLNELDNFTNIESTEFANVFLTLISLGESFWVNKVNPSMQLNEMKFISSASEAVTVTKEFINYDISAILSEQLIAEGDKKAVAEKKRAEINNILFLLKEKKDEINELVQKIGESEELTEALNLINTEIKLAEKALQETYTVEENRLSKSEIDEYANDGYVEATLSKTIDPKFKKGDLIMINAEEYASFGKDDLLKIIKPSTGESKLVNKKHVEVTLG